MARDDAGRRKSESTSDRAGALDVGARVWAKASFDEKRRLGEIVDVRREDGVAVAYYVHYSELNKRLDAWVPVEDVETRKEGEGEGKGEGGDGRGGDGDGGGAGSADDALGAHGRVNGKQPKTLTRNSKRRYNEIHNVDAPVEDLPPMDQMFERMHEEKTKVKNVHSIELGRHEMDTWYYSPYPDDFGKCSKLYLCQYCFKYMRKAKTCVRHKAECEMKHPPGKRVYRHPQGEGEPLLSFWEIDGAHFKMYCQNLCLMAKLFLDHKTLYFDVEPFMFYVLTESMDGDETHDIVGYFS